MRKNKIEGAIPNAGRKTKNRQYVTLYLDTDVADKIKEIKAVSNDDLNLKLRELLK
ncbi:MAG TPA: hypothetical protein VGE24_17690 [Emticicia sp.]